MRTFTANQVVGHTSKEDLYLVIGDKVYDVSKFVDEHPGGQEVLVGQGGADATEAFEEVGHSDEARQLLSGLELGSLIRQPGDEKIFSDSGNAYKSYAKDTANSSSPGLWYTILVIMVAIAVFVVWLYVRT